MTDSRKLYDDLDDLWTRYLNLVNEYERSQRTTQHRLATGFFLLARAQAQAPIGRRYGSECYDDRMKATVRVKIAQSDDDSASLKHDLFVVTEVSPSQHSEPNKEKSSNDVTSGVDLPTQQPSPPATPLSTTVDEKTDPSDVQSESNEEDHTTSTHQRDPITWFGILVPPNLRNAQASFKTAVCGSNDAERPGMSSSTSNHSNTSFIQSLESAAKMRALEKEIRRLRKTIKAAERDMSADGKAVKSHHNVIES